jgi:methylated-DNA-[protein]-cysteine S-methyltransferase
LNKFWCDDFESQQLGRGERAWVNELIDKVRNRNAHRSSLDDLSNDDAWRDLDTAERLLAAIGSPEAEKVRVLRLSIKDEPFASLQHEQHEVLPQSRKTPAAAATTKGRRDESGHSSLIESLHVPDLLGGLTIVGSARGLRSVRIGENESIDRPGAMVKMAESQLREYFEGKRTSFDLALDLQGTPFQLKVWSALAAIPYGERQSYRDIAVAVNLPNGAQAVGQANSRNPVLLIIPCHRVVNSDGSLGGWGPGVDRKQQLLDMEQRYSDSFRKK